MSSTPYHYPKVVAPDTLEVLIRTSAITTALDATPGFGIQATSTDVTIWFRATLSSNDESILTAILNLANVAVPLLYQGEPVDPDGAKISRPKAAKAGWAFQLHAVSFTTAALDGDGTPGKVVNSAMNPVTRVDTPLGFATVKFYASDKVTLLTAPDEMAGVVYTVLDWQVNHDMEIIAATHYQPVTPPSDLWLWTHLAPGIVNYPFGQGGINLRMVGSSASGTPLDSDGRVSKFMSATVPAPGFNKFRMTLKSAVPGYQHESMFLFKLFKSVT